MKLEIGPRTSQNLQLCLKETTSYKMQRPSLNQPYRTYSKNNSKDTYKKDKIERKIEDVLGENQFGFRKGKVTSDAI
jgi:hypothetical protein